MAVAVEFPDGSVREVPCHLREIQGGEGVIPSFEQVPLSSDPRWKFERSGTQWVARYRATTVKTLPPSSKSWWENIGLMRTGKDENIQSILLSISPQKTR